MASQPGSPEDYRAGRVLRSFLFSRDEHLKTAVKADLSFYLNIIIITWLFVYLVHMLGRC
jgi:hypothetical protein